MGLLIGRYNHTECGGNSFFSHLEAALITAQSQTDKVSDELVNIVDHLAAKEPDISQTELKEREYCTNIHQVDTDRSQNEC